MSDDLGLPEQIERGFAAVHIGHGDNIQPTCGLCDSLRRAIKAALLRAEARGHRYAWLPQDVDALLARADALEAAPDEDPPQSLEDA